MTSLHRSRLSAMIAKVIRTKAADAPKRGPMHFTKAVAGQLHGGSLCAAVTRAQAKRLKLNLLITNKANVVRQLSVCSGFLASTYARVSLEASFGNAGELLFTHIVLSPCGW